MGTLGPGQPVLTPRRPGVLAGSGGTSGAEAVSTLPCAARRPSPIVFANSDRFAA